MHNELNKKNKTPLSLLHSLVTTAKINEITASLDKHTLVIWDVDGVLINGCDKIFHSENIYSGLNDFYLTDLQNKYSLSSEQRDILLSRLLIQRQIKLVDEALPAIIHELKNRQIKCIALTQFAVGPFGEMKRTEDWRINELKKLSVEFDYSFPELAEVALNKLNKHNNNAPLYKKGILFCNRHSKGNVLGAFLDILKSQPKQIVFIDDKLDSLESVQHELTKRKIDYIGLHYTAALDMSSEINDSVVKFQFDYFKTDGLWLNDQEALKKLT
jgi:hypothetical protein